MLSTRIYCEGALRATIEEYLERCVIASGAQVRDVVVIAGAEGAAMVDVSSVIADADTGRVAAIVDRGALLALGGDSALLAAAGVRVGQPLPPHPVRMLGGSTPSSLLRGLDDLGEPVSAVLPLGVSADGVEVLLSAPVGLDRVAIVTWSRRTNVIALGLGLDEVAALRDGGGLRLIHRLVRGAATGAIGDLPPVRVGLLGYGAIGAEHLAGFAAAGFDVVAACDRSEARLATVLESAPGVRTYAKADELIGDDGVDLVAISTPPDSHTRWAMECLKAGKHTVVEKPLALTASDADLMLDTAEQSGLTMVVYQNRRFDPDFLALERIVRSGGLGRVFHLEAFVGGYGHPCNYWHSDVAVSGGTAFDWGSHYLDQILALIPEPLLWVSGSSHKLRWHDVTNADHIRIELRFADGTDASFVHSDLASCLKPKWYVLGSDAGVVGNWREEKVVSRNAIGTLDEDRLAPADSPADMWMHYPDGSRTALALPRTAPGRYHRELADYLLRGEPMTAEPRQSRDVVAVLEAAVRSAERDGRPESCTTRSR